jgi:23S rRNA (adenine1618-N6)-methyltransferase
VSKKDNLQPLYRILEKTKVVDFKVVDMVQGQKTSRFVAWTYMTQKQRSVFANKTET